MGAVLQHIYVMLIYQLLLLDLKTEIAEKAKERILKSRPPLLFEKDKINSLKVGNITDRFDSVSKADWIIEAVVERIDIKHNIYDQIFKKRKRINCFIKYINYSSKSIIRKIK